MRAPGEMTRSLEPTDFQEKRKEPRTSCRRLIDILPCQAHKDWKFITGELIDCSRGGLAVLLPEPMEVGHQFLVKLRVGGNIKLLVYTVHNCCKWERSNYRVGAKFSTFAAQHVDEDPDTLLKALLRGE